ncbi:PT domain-containing protein [Streptomyces cuspidosporus]|uniref:TetR family transcriptional regulator n=1 Tax=Streptomyces cuspidosporus TaxID=66882 RepID=A0ABP5U6G7_9ACTN
MTAGLRELKKQQTRQAISDTATRLFLERGFEAVTIAEIAAAAQVAKMTVTNYFPRKEDLALDYHEPFTAALAHTVAGRREGESALAALRREYLAAVERHDPAIGFTGSEFARMIADSPALTARLRELHDQREDALADVLADAFVADSTAGPADEPAAERTDQPAVERTDEPAAERTDEPAADPAADPGDLTPRAVAALLTAVHRTLFQQVLDLTRAGRANEEIATAVTRSAHQVFGLLEASLGDYAVR